MKCPKCGKDLELQKKQVGVDENGTPVFNEYAICRDCRKQWNLDKQRAKKAAEKAASAAESEGKPVSTTNTEATKPAAVAPAKELTGKTASAKPTAKKVIQEPPASKQETSGNIAPMPQKKTDGNKSRTTASGKKPTSSERRGSSDKKSIDFESRAAASERKNVSSANKTSARKIAVSSDGKTVSTDRKPTSSAAKATTKKNAAGASSQNAASPTDSRRYGNIPPEKIRAKREQAVRSSYEEMLATDPNSKFAKKKKASTDPASSKKAKRHTEPTKNTSAAKFAPEMDEELEAPAPKFRVLRIVFGLISIAAFGFFAYKGFLAGLNNISSGSATNAGTTYIVLALCMLLSGLLLLIMNKKRTVFAFLLPMLFYIGSAVFAFLKRSSDKWLLYGAVLGAILAVIFLILAIASGRADDEDYYEDEYDDSFDEDHDSY